MCLVSQLVFYQGNLTTWGAVFNSLVEKSRSSSSFPMMLGIGEFPFGSEGAVLHLRFRVIRPKNVQLRCPYIGGISVYIL